MAGQPKYIGVVTIVRLPGHKPMLLLQRQGRCGPPEQGGSLRPNRKEGICTVALFGPKKNAEHPANTVTRLMEETFGLAPGNQKNFRIHVGKGPAYAGNVDGQAAEFYLLEITESRNLHRLRAPIGSSLELICVDELDRVKIVGKNTLPIAAGDIWMDQVQQDAMNTALDQVMAAAN